MGDPPLQKDYYKAALRGPQVAITCPLCHQKGRLAAHLREIGRRIPDVLAQGMAVCHICGETVLRYNEAMIFGLKIWFCEDCQICICPRCQDPKTKH